MEVGRIIEKGYFRHELNIKDISKNKVEKVMYIWVRVLLTNNTSE